MNQKPKQLTVVRLHPDIYMKLEKQFSKLTVNESTTAFQMGYALGVENILKELRNGLTMEVDYVQAS